MSFAIFSQIWHLLDQFCSVHSAKIRCDLLFGFFCSEFLIISFKFTIFESPFSSFMWFWCLSPNWPNRNCAIVIYDIQMCQWQFSAMHILTNSHEKVYKTNGQHSKAESSSTCLAFQVLYTSLLSYLNSFQLLRS